jgi:hypothetical protein
MHSYIVTGPEAQPVVITIEERMSVSYLACRSITQGPELTQRTFGESFTHAWPAFEHDVLVALVQGGMRSTHDIPNRSAVAGLAAAILSRKEVPTAHLGSPLATLLSANRSPEPVPEPEPEPDLELMMAAAVSGDYALARLLSPKPKAKAAVVPKKPSALKSLMST